MGVGKGGILLVVCCKGKLLSFITEFEDCDCDGCDLATVPLWIQHGNRDEAVPISESEKIVKAIKNCNGGENLKYTRLVGKDHGDLEKIFRTDEMYDWLFQFTKEE